MAKFHCEACGQDHDLSNVAIALQRPYHYFEVPEKERASRIKINDDLCSIDGKLFLIRGVLQIPIKGTDGTFDWGLWALIDRSDFDRYLKLWDVEIDPDEPPMPGLLSGNPPGYPEANLTDLTIHLQSGGQRPLFKVVDSDQQLAIDQREGISFEKIHPLIEKLQGNH